MATVQTLKSSEAFRLLPKRRLSAHKGENGRVLIVGGSKDYYGAPIMAGMAAFSAGVDIVHLLVPNCVKAAAQAHCANFIIHTNSEEYLSEKDFNTVKSLQAKVDVVLIGPGISANPDSLQLIKRILKELNIPTVLDAEAISVLKEIEKFPLEQEIIITPHLKEFQNLVDRQLILDQTNPQTMILLRTVAMDLHINILLKGMHDYLISQEGYTYQNLTGNPGMTVAGTGDALAGLVAGYFAQGVDAYDSIKIASFYFGKTADKIKKTHGFGYTPSDLIELYPKIAK